MTQIVINGKSCGELAPQMLPLFKKEVIATVGSNIEIHTDNLLIVTTTNAPI